METITNRTDDLTEPISCTDAAEWEAWLDEHHADRDHVWIKIAKKASGIPSVDPEQGTTVALCFGWIDGHRKSFDDTHFLQRYSPRTRRSPWSEINSARAEELIAAGRVRPAGMTAIEAAKADGRWNGGST